MMVHTKENYYKIIGYATDYKPKKKYGIRTADSWRRDPLTDVNNTEMASTSQYSGDGQGTSKATRHYFINEKYKQILNLLNNNPGDHHTNIAYIVSYFMSKFTPYEWIVDSGGTHHITANLDMLKDNSSVNITKRDKVHYQLRRRLTSYISVVIICLANILYMECYMYLSLSLICY